MTENILYDATVYARLSREDMNGIESNSIINQINLIKDYVRSMPRIRIVSIRKDDGYSGVDFFRPEFGAMMEDVKKGKTNCIIVKDFSRFGRDHLGMAEYINQIFPFLGVRFISVNDHYDSLNPKTDSDSIVIPFKNLVNESYLRDISIKVRSSLESKRQKGEFVAAFTHYGYLRDPQNKHKMIVDEYAAEVVRKIFKWKMKGMSHQSIADCLNELDELSPIEYKNTNGINLVTPMKKRAVCEWTYITVDRILKNPVYIGTMVQGKETTPNYKVKKRIMKPEEERAVFHNAHSAIISKSDFDIVSSLLNTDTHSAPKSNTVHLFAGIVFCGDCGNTMIRKTVGSKDKKYFYYMCGTNKYQGECSSHSFKEEELYRIVLNAIASHIQAVLDREQCIDLLRNVPKLYQETIQANEQVFIREREIDALEQKKKDLYEDYKAGIVNRTDFILFDSQYSEKAEKFKHSITQLKAQAEILMNNNAEAPSWIDQFNQFWDITELSRQLIVTLIKRIELFEGKRVRITFTYQDKYKMSGLTDG